MNNKLYLTALEKWHKLAARVPITTFYQYDSIVLRVCDYPCILNLPRVFQLSEIANFGLGDIVKEEVTTDLSRLALYFDMGFSKMAPVKLR